MKYMFTTDCIIVRLMWTNGHHYYILWYSFVDSKKSENYMKKKFTPKM